MSARLRAYGLALACVGVTCGIRFLLIPLLGNRFGFDLFLISSFISGRYLGFGPSLVALLTGAVPVSLFHFLGQDLRDPFFAVGLGMYFTLGAIVVALCKTESDSRGAMEQEIVERRKALEALQREQDLLEHTIEIQEQERQLITYEIHDGLLQYATGALLQLEALREKVGSHDMADSLANVVTILQRAVFEGRQLINGIRSSVLDDSGVVAAVEQLIEDEDRAHVSIEFVRDENLGRMITQIEEALYRIAQEALTNVRKHSRSQRVRVELWRRDNRVGLLVRDWGIGFTPANGHASVHGIHGMTERARIAGGRCTIESAPGQGTTVSAEFPYRARN